jgi:hypothetical protein
MSSDLTHSRETRAHACELKFFVDRVVGDQIAEWARRRLPADRHANGPTGDQYVITSVYFDTQNLDVFHGRGSFGRSKYRARRYGAADVVFLERKMRRPRLLHKRRSIAPLDDLDCLEQADSRADWNGRWFHRRLLARRLSPTCQLTYVRTAREIETDHGVVRLTLDNEIRVRPISRVAFDEEPATPVLAEKTVVELKFRHVVPAIFKELIETFALTPCAGSKYRFGMKALGHQMQGEPA